MKHAGFEYKFRSPLAPPDARGGKPPAYRHAVERGMIVERDLPVKMRDGVEIYIDVFRPADEQPAAPIIAWGPYGKHGHTRYAENFPNCGVKQETLSPYTAFEAPAAGYWVPRGYAVINPDPPGSG